MLAREYVSASPRRILDPPGRPVRVEVWAVARILERQSDVGARVYLSLTESECSVSRGVPIPADMPIRLDLEGGQSLWAISTDEGFIGISVLER